MINPSNFQQRFSALTQNPETVTYGVRTTQSGTDGPDSYTNYTLNLAQRRDANKDDLAGTNLLASEETLVWEILQSDLAAAGAPAPEVTYQITDNSDTVWIVAKRTGRYFNTKFDCTCYKAH